MADFRSARWFATTMAVAWLAWFVFTGENSLQEMLAGVGCALFTAWFCIRTWRQMGLQIPMRLADFLEGWQVPWTLITGALQVIAVLAKDLTTGPRAASIFCAVPFERAADGTGMFRRVLAVSFTSISPNTIVIGVDRQRGLLLYHAICPVKLPEMTQSLGARA
ncbi:MAG TPA: Na+/H+ antiporter subunit E [Terracidiphilus sp.]|nr:Na+/H+ antiporter subunit E [Terracidiphilus sp.]